MVRLTEEELEELEGALSRASPGPWRLKDDGTPHRGMIHVEENGHGIETVATCYCGAYNGHGAANAAAIAALRNAASALLSEVREARRLLGAWQEAAENHCHGCICRPDDPCPMRRMLSEVTAATAASEEQK